MLKKFRHHRYFPHFFGLAVLALVLLFFFFLTQRAYSGVKIIDTHEHIESMAKAEELRLAMGNLGISKTILIPSPIETITLNGNSTFTDYEQNIDEILKIGQSYPDDFIPFCTISPLDSNALQIFQDCVKRGGQGLKLYNGHSFFYKTFQITLDSGRMKPIYAYAERNGLPVLYHVNIANYGEELKRVLNDYPDLSVSVPHYMVSSIALQNVEALLDEYPNLYTDISFGHTPFMAAGFRRISLKIEKYEAFFEKYSDRILFGTDMVLTEIEKKDQDYMEEILDCYRNLLEKKSFTCDPVNDYYLKERDKNQEIYDNCLAKSGDFCKSKLEKVASYTRWYEETKTLNGLNLSSSQLRKIYGENPERWLGVATHQ